MLRSCSSSCTSAGIYNQSDDPPCAPHRHLPASTEVIPYFSLSGIRVARFRKAGFWCGLATGDADIHSKDQILCEDVGKD